MERRLGRGLDSLLGGKGDAGATPDAEPGRGGGVRVLSIQQVRPNPNQPRKVFDSALLEELRDSIRLHGVLQPILVRSTPGGAFEIVAGERRWRAARLAGLREIPATILDGVDDRRITELALVENVQRADLDPIEKAQAFRVLIDELGLTQEGIAERVGQKRSSVANHLRLLDLPREAQEAIITGLITLGHAKVLLGAEASTVRGLLGRIVREDLSVRQLEQVLASTGKKKPSARRPDAAPEPWARDLESRLRERLGARVEVQNGSGYRGRIVIHYHDRAALERLMAQLAAEPEL